MNLESAVILSILETVCNNFPIGPEDREKAIGEFQKYMPLQDRGDLRKCLLRIHEDLNTWDGQTDGIKVIRKLYMEITKTIKGTPLSGKTAGLQRGFVWSILKRGIKKSDPAMINVTIVQIQRILGGYVSG